MCTVLDANQFHSRARDVQPQQQQPSSNIVYVQVPSSGGRWNGRHYLHAQSKCLGAVLVTVGSFSVVGNIVMGVFAPEWVAWYLTRAVLCATMVSTGLHAIIIIFIIIITF